MDPPHPRGVKRAYTCCGDVCCVCRVCCAVCLCLWLCGLQLYTLHLLISGHDRRTEPKFGSHVRIDTLTSKKKKIDPPHPGGGGWLCGWQLYTLHLLISGHDRRTEPKFGSHVRIDTLTLKKKIDAPHPGGGGLRGYILLKIFRDGSRPNLARMCG